MIFTHTMILQVSFFSKGLKPFKSINMSSPFHKDITMIKCCMFAIKLQRFIRSKTVVIKDTAFFRMSSNFVHQSLCRNIINNGSEVALVALIILDFTGKAFKFLLQKIKNYITILLIIISDLFVSKVKFFYWFIGRNPETKVMQHGQIVSYLLITIFQRATLTFESIVRQSVEFLMITPRITLASNYFMNSFFYNQLKYNTWSLNKLTTFSYYFQHYLHHNLSNFIVLS